MEVVVVKEHVSEYPNPIYLKHGEEVCLGQVDDEFPNWIFVTTKSGVQGWAPVQYIEKMACDKLGIVRQDYDSLELNTVMGEKLSVLLELNSWYRVARSEDEIGWVPVHTVRRT